MLIGSPPGDNIAATIRHGRIQGNQRRPAGITASRIAPAKTIMISTGPTPNMFVLLEKGTFMANDQMIHPWQDGKQALTPRRKPEPAAFRGDGHAGVVITASVA
jgi:hypothetical protein